jgi:uncharacterized damage-inducible protein DinB
MFYNTINQTSLLSLLQDMTAYNLWAITRLTDWLGSKPVAVLEAAAASSFPGIKATLLHIWDVERGWLAHLQQAPAPASMRQGFDGTMEEVLEKLVEHAAELNDYVHSLTEEELQEDCYCNVLFVGEICQPKFEIIQHCLNHSSYHRGQVVTIGHQVGLKDAPMTDYMYYVLRVKDSMSFVGKAGKREAAPATFSRNSFLAVNFFK